MAKEEKKAIPKLEIEWKKPSISYHGKFEETFCRGHYNGIVVAQNRFLRGDLKTGNNDISYKIAGVSGWIPYEKFVKLLLKEDKRREPARQQLRARGLLQTID